MAETRFCDCEGCGRNNVIGYKIEKKEQKIAKAGGAGYGLLVGALLGGPVGAAIGFAAGKFGGDKIADGMDDGYAEFQFQCPGCGRRFTKIFKI